MKNPHKAIGNCTGSTINVNLSPHHPTLNPTETKDTANKYRRVSLAQSKIRSIYSTVSKLPKKTIGQIGKTMTCLVLFIFAMNAHFILFLRLKKINVITFDSYYLNNATRENYSRVKMHHSFECSSDLGTWYINFLEEAWFWLDVLVYFLVPFITMCITFSIISFKLKKINQNYATFVHEDNGNNYNRLRFIKKIRRNKKIIYILFGINLYFCLSILPFFTFTIFKENQWYSSIRDNHTIKSFVEILFYSNNAFNFFFYGISSKDYRKELSRMFFAT